MNKMTARCKPVLRWPGGKSRLLKLLLPLVPPHEIYCEPFAGGLAMLLAKPRSKMEIVNDLNQDIVSLYRCAQYHLDELLRELEWIVACRENMKLFTQQPGLTDIQRAARFLMRNRTCFAGSMSSYGVSRTCGGVTGSREQLQEKLRELNRRMDRVSVENVSYERCLRLYDSDRTFFFMDPPYFASDPGDAYQGWSETQMREFAEKVHKLKGSWIVTVDDSTLNRELFAQHQITPVQTRNQCGKQGCGKTYFGELIICKNGASSAAVA